MFSRMETEPKVVCKELQDFLNVVGDPAGVALVQINDNYFIRVDRNLTVEGRVKQFCNKIGTYYAVKETETKLSIGECLFIGPGCDGLPSRMPRTDKLIF
jgi:hypothetical protein